MKLGDFMQAVYEATEDRPDQWQTGLSDIEAEYAKLAYSCGVTVGETADRIVEIRLALRRKGMQMVQGEVIEVQKPPAEPTECLDYVRAYGSRVPNMRRQLLECVSKWYSEHLDTPWLPHSADQALFDAYSVYDADNTAEHYIRIDDLERHHAVNRK